MAKIQLTDTTMDALVKMADGNPGAATAMIAIMKDAEKIDPDSALGGLGNILQLDDIGIYGTDIYVLWSDICERDSVKFIGVLRAVQLGFFDRRILKDAASRQDYSGRGMVPVDELLIKVREVLPEFGKI